MGQSPDTAVSSQNPPAAPPALRLGCELWLIVLLALIVGLACRGHYAKPYSDFFEFVDVGHALLAGELPHTLKRGVVYPVLVVAASKLLPGECPERTAAEWLSVALLAINAGLLFVIARPRLANFAAWPAAWFTLLPLTAYCTAILLVEPMLTTALLATVVLAGRGSRWTWVAAALTPLVRLDGAAALLAPAVADLVRGRKWSTILIRGLVAALPLAAWLGLTTLTWSQRSDDHTLARMAAAPTFDLLTPTLASVRATLDITLIERLSLGLIPAAALWHALPALVLALACMAVVAGIRQRDAAAIAAAATLVGLLIAQAVVPFSVERYVHPATALLSALAAIGLGALCRPVAIHTTALATRSSLARLALNAILALVLVASAIPLTDRAQTWTSRAMSADRFEGRLALLGLLALAATWGLSRFAPGRRLAALAGLAFVAAVGIEQIARSSARLGPGDDMKNVIEAARWIRDNTPHDAGVLSDDPGLLRAYVGRQPQTRFVHFSNIAADTWPEIVAECRTRGVRYIIWHEHMLEHHGGYYGEKYRLERFRALNAPDTLAELRPVQRMPKRPALTILELLPAADQR